MKPALTIQQACEVLSSSHATVWKLIRRGEIKGFKVGRSVRIAHDEIERFMERNVIEPKSVTADLPESA